MLSKASLLVTAVQKMLKGDFSMQVSLATVLLAKLLDKGLGPSLSNSALKGGVVWACCEERVLTRKRQPGVLCPEQYGL